MNRLTEQLAKIQDTKTTPAELSAILLEFSADYAAKVDELQQLLVLKVATWQKLRGTVGSDTQAERAWQATPEGIAETGLKLQMKSLSQLMSALKTHLRNKELEARNLM